jgi:hypothetical protein
MGWIIEAFFDWIVVGVLDKLARRLPPWGCAALIVTLIAGIAALIWLVR